MIWYSMWQPWPNEVNCVWPETKVHDHGHPLWCLHPPLSKFDCFPTYPSLHFLYNLDAMRWNIAWGDCRNVPSLVPNGGGITESVSLGAHPAHVWHVDALRHTHTHEPQNPSARARIRWLTTAITWLTPQVSLSIHIDWPNWPPVWPPMIVIIK